MARKRKRKRSRVDQYYEEVIVLVNRFNDLSEDILYHILSFLDDTRFAVQTSVLSRRWRYLWKDVPALHLRTDKFPTGDRFETFLTNLLSLRSRHATTLHSIRFDFRSWLVMIQRGERLFDTVMRYDASLRRDDHHGGGGLLRVLSISHCWQRELHRMATSVARHHHHESLETLELAECCSVGLSEIATSFGTTILTTLELRGCSLAFRDDDDPFANLPRLKCLKILDCASRSSAAALKVSGLQLLTLEVRNSITIRELLAPRLESFSYSRFVGLLAELRSNLPSLGHASVRIIHSGIDSYDDEYAHAVTSLLRGLRNIKSLDLCFEDTTTSRTRHSTFIETMKPRIEKEVAQFTRLKTLRIRYLPDSPSSTSEAKDIANPGASMTRARIS